MITWPIVWVRSPVLRKRGVWLKDVCTPYDVCVFVRFTNVWHKIVFPFVKYFYLNQMITKYTNWPQIVPNVSLNVSILYNIPKTEANFSPGAKLSLRGEFCPLGVKLSPGVKFSVCPLLNSRECSPGPGGERRTKGWTFPLGDTFHPWRPSSPLGVKFTPGSQGWS
jgi:hypothetical protein